MFAFSNKYFSCVEQAIAELSKYFQILIFNKFCEGYYYVLLIVLLFPIRTNLELKLTNTKLHLNCIDVVFSA